MKKLTLALVAAALAVPALAQTDNPPLQGQAPAVQAEHQAFKKAHQEHRAQMKATQEKMTQLVKEYNKLKAGKKKEAKRAELEQEVNAIHEKQLAFKQDQLAQFEERLARMKAELAQENTADAKKAWVTQKTDALVQADGNVRILFEPERGMNPGRGATFGPRGKAPGRHFGKHDPKGPVPGPQMQHPGSPQEPLAD